MHQVLENKKLWRPQANYLCGYLLQLHLISKGNKVQFSFITGPNITRNIGVLLKHLPYGKSKIPIGLIQSTKTVTSNGTGMYFYSVIAIYTIQNDLQTNLHNFFHFGEFQGKKSKETIGLMIFAKQVFDGIYVNVIGKFKNSLLKLKFFIKYFYS